MAFDLCLVKQAQKPYYIENISTPVWSIEELCYYFCENIYLIDETVCNELLCDWIRDELGLTRLYQTLYDHLERGDGTGQFVLAVFREIGYLSNAQMREYQEKLRAIEVQPEEERRKMKADYLVRCGMYANAVSQYRQILSSRAPGHLGAAFDAAVWNNLGTAYARSFQFETAAACYLNAWKKGRSREMLRRYISALPLYLTDEEYKEKLKELGADAELIQVIQEYNARVARESLQQQGSASGTMPQEELAQLTAQYRAKAKVTA